MGDIKQRAYDALVTTIHTVVLEPARWDALLKRIADTVNADSAAFYLRDKLSGIASQCNLVGYPEALTLCFQDAATEVDPWTRIALRANVGVWVSQTACFDDRRLNPDTATMLARLGLSRRSAIACRVFDDGRNEALLGFQRDAGAAPFAREDNELLSRLSQHLELACRLSSEFSRLRLQAAVARQALDRLATPIWVLDVDGTILFANHAAQQGLPCLSVKKGRLQADTSPVSTRLASLLAQATGPKPRSGALALDHEEGGRHTVLVAPLPPESPLAADWRRPLVLLMAHNPMLSDAQPLEVLSALYGLSPAECRLASLLLEGCSPAEAADRLMVQVSTIRTQLKSMFWKTGTHRQGELVKLLSGALLLKA
ncbi:helix-turn-helix transcriptional regulator [Chitinimonas sp.]|uniref:helix-turn-helix transcriptional regulator n=1 Tax=Chitinimonas sp. TaxID=1934313 RepID=UPI0035B39C21